MKDLRRCRYIILDKSVKYIEQNDVVVARKLRLAVFHVAHLIVFYFTKMSFAHLPSFHNVVCPWVKVVEWESYKGAGRPCMYIKVPLKIIFFHLVRNFSLFVTEIPVFLSVAHVMIVYVCACVCVLCCVVMCYAVLCCVVLCCVVFCRAVLSSNKAMSELGKLLNNVLRCWLFNGSKVYFLASYIPCVISPF